MKQLKRIGALLLLICVLCLSACTAAEKPAEQSETTATAATVETAAAAKTEEAGDPLWKDALYTTDTSFGTGAKKIEVKVEAGEKSVTFTVNTDKENLADALLEHKLVEGEDSQYGLYIKKVNGISADYNTDGYWWSLNQNGAALSTGASDTKIAGGEAFELVRTKA